MPDENGRLSPKESRAAQEWLHTVVKNPQCPLCSEQQMALAEYVVGVPSIGKHGIMPMHVSPLLLSVCSICGHVRFFSARAAGIYKDDHLKRGK